MSHLWLILGSQDVLVQLAIPSIPLSSYILCKHSQLVKRQNKILVVKRQIDKSNITQYLDLNLWLCYQYCR